MKPMKVPNAIQARAGDVIVERDGRWLSMPEETYEQVRRALDLPALTTNRKPSRDTERIRQIVYAVSSMCAGGFGPVSAQAVADRTGRPQNRAAAELFECVQSGHLIRSKFKPADGSRTVWGYEMAQATNGASH